MRTYRVSQLFSVCPFSYELSLNQRFDFDLPAGKSVHGPVVLIETVVTLYPRNDFLFVVVQSQISEISSGRPLQQCVEVVPRLVGVMVSQSFTGQRAVLETLKQLEVMFDSVQCAYPYMYSTIV